MKRLGVVGTLVWDTIIERDGRVEPFEEWGGIAYALGALEAALPQGWIVVPIIKVGKDLAEPALRFLRGLPRTDVDTSVRVVQEPNNRVQIRYDGMSSRSERLTGGVSPWIWPELRPVVETCDALYVNFISGFEMGLDAARSLRARFDGPTYADLHSLFLGVGQEGLRIPQQLPAAGNWLRSFDAVQMNETEFELLGQTLGDPWAVAAQVVGPELKLITVTMGSAGAGYIAGAGFHADPEEWPATRHRVAAPGTATSGRVRLETHEEVGDPTGCGDVWGATFFARLLAGDDFDAAMGAANRMAARNVKHRGASGLHRYLTGRLSASEGSG